jgi:hypothetical protein
MRKVDFLHLAKTFARQVDSVMLLKEEISLAQRSKLRTMALELLEAADHVAPRTGPAHMARSLQAKKDYETEPFRLHWRSTDRVTEIAGWQALALMCGLSVSSLRMMLSKGRGKITRALYDEHGNVDNVSIYRTNYMQGTGRPSHVVPEKP